jgi:plasmid maintenance system killer protein
MLAAAPNLGALASIPGNRLEPLKTGRKGQYSIRINLKYRVCGRRGITADTALRLARYLGSDPQFWMNLQPREKTA